jgi:hypothetical protein
MMRKILNRKAREGRKEKLFILGVLSGLRGKKIGLGDS